MSGWLTPAPLARLEDDATKGKPGQVVLRQPSPGRGEYGSDCPGSKARLLPKSSPNASCSTPPCCDSFYSECSLSPKGGESGKNFWRPDRGLCSVGLNQALRMKSGACNQQERFSGPLLLCYPSFTQLYFTLLGFFRQGLYVAQAGFKLAMQRRMPLNL